MALVEREKEVAELRDLLSLAASGEGAAAVIEGEAGVGKSSLLDRAAELAELHSMRVLRAVGSELETEFAFGVARQLFSAVVAEAGEEVFAGPAELTRPVVDPEATAEADRAEPSFGLLHALYWLVSNLSERGPLAILVDDAQLTDSPSLRMLDFISRRREGLPVAIVSTVRTGEPGADSVVATLSAAPGSRRLAPAPLTVAGTENLIAQSGEQAAERAVLACHDLTHGNPFLLNELLLAVHRDGIALDDRSPALLAKLVPDSITQSVLLRLGRLPGEANAVARAVAVLGDGAPLHHVAAVSGVDQEAILQAGIALTDAGIFGADRPLSFAHPLLHAAVESDISANEGSLAHQRAVAALREDGVGADRLASHLLLTQPGGDPDVVDVLLEAAETAAAQGAFDSAGRFLGRAVEEPPSPERRCAVLARLSEAELATGDPASAVEDARESLRLADSDEERARAAIAMAHALVPTAGFGDAVATLEAEVEAISDEQLRLGLEAEMSWLGLFDPDSVPRLRARFGRYADLPGRTTVERSLLGSLALRKIYREEPVAEAAELALRALGDGQLVADLSADAVAITGITWALVLADRIDEAEAEIRGAIANAQRRGSVQGFAMQSTMLSASVLRRGGLREAEELNQTVEEVCAQMGETLWAARLRFSTGARQVAVLVERGELDEAEQTAERSGLNGDMTESNNGRELLHRATLRREQGRLEEALADQLAMGEYQRRMVENDPSLAWRAEAAMTLGHLDRHPEAVVLADEAIGIARRIGSGSALGVALRARGLAEKEGEAGIGFLRDAVSVLETTPVALEHARAEVDLGAALRRAGKRTEARGPLEAGMERAARCGADVLAERAREELVVAGAKPRRLMFSGVEGLTAAERRVAAMAARGMTNREIAQDLFITKKTVDNHLTRIYRKLDIASRAELPADLASAEAA